MATLSQAAAVAPQWKLGVGYEFEERPDGLRGMEAAYGLKFNGSPRTMDLGLLYRAIVQRQVDIIAGNSTDGPIQPLHLTILADDRHYFPPYDAVPLFREDAYRRWPQMRTVVAELAGKTARSVDRVDDPQPRAGVRRGGESRRRLFRAQGIVGELPVKVAENNFLR